MTNTRVVRALVRAFNVNNYARDTVKTNFALETRDKQDSIEVSFDKGMSSAQCTEYLKNIKRKIVREFYRIEENDDKEILNTANLIFDVRSFPFSTSEGKLSKSEHGGFKFITPIDQGVVFNLKSHLASSLAKDVLEDMQVSSTTVAFNRNKYLDCNSFLNRELREQFVDMFSSRMGQRYKNVPENLWEVKGNDVYIRDGFDDASFVDSITQRTALLIGLDLQASSENRSDVKAFKNLIIEFINRSTGLTMAGFIRIDKELDKTKALIPVVLDNGKPRVLADEEILKLNYAFNYAVFNELDSGVPAELPIEGDDGIYNINFFDKIISHCVINKIIENSVINKNHELAIDPELSLRLQKPPSKVSQTQVSQQERPRRQFVGCSQS